MKCFETIEGQQPAITSLQRMLSGGRVPSALLFLGPHHVGKRTTALALAKALNCSTGEGCGLCPACRKIDEGVHPDVEVVAPDGQFIKIDQVRAVSDLLGLVPFEARKRVVVLSQAERMNQPAANAFLKTLEEPPTDTLIVLCASTTSELFDTIVSRCMPLRFGLLPEPALRGVVSGNVSGRKGLSGEGLEFAVKFARGQVRPDLLERVQPWMAIREDLIENWGRLDSSALPELSQKFTKWGGTEDWKFVLEWLETWYHDLALLGGGAPRTRLVNSDRMDALQTWGRLVSSPVALACYRRLLEARAASRLNVNKQLGLEALWLDCRKLTLREHKEAAA